MTHPITEKLKAYDASVLLAAEEFRGDLTVTVPKPHLVRVATFLKTDPDLAFDMLIDVAGVDMYRSEDRFEVVYTLYSLTGKRYLRLKTRVDEQDPTLPSLTGVWAAANWHEREAYDMFGLKFTGHPDLRRLYMPDEFEYYPLRKDFPTMGIPDSLPLPRR